MRMRVNRLVYVLLGAALLALARQRLHTTRAHARRLRGLLWTLPSVTALSLSSSTVTYGNEQVEKFSVKVSAGSPGTGVPTGYVVVESGTKILCSIHLSPRDGQLLAGHQGTGARVVQDRGALRRGQELQAVHVEPEDPHSS